MKNNVKVSLHALNFNILDLLSAKSQFFTFVFQSHVWRSTSKYKPLGHRIDAKRLILISPELSHLNFFLFHNIVFIRQLLYILIHELLKIIISREYWEREILKFSNGTSCNSREKKGIRRRRGMNRFEIH